MPFIIIYQHCIDSPTSCFNHWKLLYFELRAQKQGLEAVRPTCQSSRSSVDVAVFRGHEFVDVLDVK